MPDTSALADPLAAVTHPQPYEYYAALRAVGPVHWNGRHRFWVAANAGSVEALLHAPSARVRPLDEPVPRWLAGTIAGEFFGALVRMNDGAAHDALRVLVHHRLTGIDDGSLPRDLAPVVGADAASLDDFIERFPIYCLASALGVGKAALPRTFECVRALARSFASDAGGEEIAAGSKGAAALIETFAGATGERSVAINDAGLLIQTYDATRGLLANTLAALARHPRTLALARHDPATVASVVEHTSRYDSPVHNTRRFLAEDFTIGVTAMRKGDAVLLVLASANWDPSATHSYTFGSGTHACAGRRIAMAIAAAGVRAVLDSGLDIARACRPVAYKPSPNARIALFGTP